MTNVLETRTVRAEKATMAAPLPADVVTVPIVSADGWQLPVPSAAQLLQAVGIALYVTDAEGRIRFFNEAAVDLWGRRPADGELWCGSLRLFWPDGRPMAHAECPMAQALQEQRSVRGGMATAERTDGSRVTFMAYPTPLLDGDGRLVGAINLMVDVTDRVAAERAIGRLDAVKDEFLGLVSHELRTPVTTIYGNAQLLMRVGKVGSRVRRMLGDIAHDSERLLGIVENLLLLTRSGAGTQPDREPQLLTHFLRRACAAFAERRRRIVNYNGPIAGHVLVEADRAYLELLVNNLLSNADKYSPLDEPIDVRLDVDATRGEARVAVLDRGFGLSESDEAELFAPFYRSASARRQASGMGIGLTVCRRIAESLGGRMWARNRDGGGAEVGFALPLMDVPGN